MERHDAIRIVRVFLASPGDLSAERRAARAAVDEINRTVARPSGFHVDLIGWEDTLSAAGRPQATINEDLESCQMFIGMLWSRWGTPPDDAGRFTSGFEEEFTLASERHARDGSPHMTLFFKDVDKSQLADPGPEFSKVLAFKQRVIEERKLLFETFTTTAELEAKVRLGVAAYIHRLERASGTSSGGNASSAEPISDETDADQATASVTLGTSTEAEFLNDAGRIVGTEAAGLTPAQVARLRLIGMAAGHGSNDEDAIGSHDANLLYRGRKGIEFSTRERSALADAGVEAVLSETKPLWTWLVDCVRRFPPWLTYTTASGPDARRIGALRVSALLGDPIPYDDHYDDERLKEAWFGGSASTAVRNAALEYIGERRDAAYLALAESELERNDYTTRKSALDAIALIRSRNSVRDAALWAVNASFDALGGGAMDAVLAGMAELDDDDLGRALGSRSSAIRARAVALLAERGGLGEAALARLFEDPSTQVRIAAVAAFEVLVRPLTPTEAEKAYVKKPEQNSRGLLGSGFDAAADAAHNAWKRRALSRAAFADLQEDGPHALALEDRLAGLAGGHLKLIVDDLRSDIDDRFVSHWRRYLEILRGKVGSADGADKIVDMFDAHQEFRRKNLMRIALDAIESLDDPRDLPRVRKALDEEACERTAADIDYFSRIGGWEDIARIGKVHGSSGVAALLVGSDRKPAGTARAVLKLAGDRIAELLTQDLPHGLLVAVLTKMPSARFRQLGTKAIEELLLHKDASVRKTTSLKTLVAYPSTETRRLLTRYVESEGTRYYNVIFWLDLAAAFTRDVYRRIAERELARTQS